MFSLNKNTKKRFRNVEIGANACIDDFSEIGEYTYIGNNCLVTKAVIGRFCSLGNNVSIGPGEHKIDMVSTSAFIYNKVNWYDQLTIKNVNIGNDVWIGTDCIVRRGVNVGNGAVIGANSFVNQNVPDYAVVAGNPARIVSYRFDDMIIKLLCESQWWNLSLEEARKFCEEFEAKYKLKW